MTPGPAAPESASAEPRDAGGRSMTRVYAAVMVVEVVTLLALWWFQTTFGAR